MSKTGSEMIRTALIEIPEKAEDDTWESYGARLQEVVSTTVTTLLEDLRSTTPYWICDHVSTTVLRLEGGDRLLILLMGRNALPMRR